MAKGKMKAKAERRYTRCPKVYMAMLQNRVSHHSDDTYQTGEITCVARNLRCASLRFALQRCGALRFQPLSQTPKCQGGTSAERSWHEIFFSRHEFPHEKNYDILRIECFRAGTEGGNFTSFLQFSGPFFDAAK